MTVILPCGCDPEIERLLGARRVVHALVEQAGRLLDARAFPKSARAMDALAREFEAELEINLLRAYDAAPHAEPGSLTRKP